MNPDLIEAKSLERQRLIEDLRRIDADAGDRALTAGENQRAENLMRGVERLEREIADLVTQRDSLVSQRNARIAGIVESTRAVEGGDGAAGIDEHRRGTGFHVSRGRTRGKVDISTYDVDAVRGNVVERATELHGRAERVVESAFGDADDDARERALQVLADADDANPTATGVSEHILRASNPHYVSAFRKWLVDGEVGLAGLTPEEGAALRDVRAFTQRTAMAEGTSTAGGFLVPSFLDPSIILTNAGTSNPFRQISRVIPVSTQVWKGVTSAGVTAEWASEAQEAADASPTVAQPTITPIRAQAWIQFSYELTQDSNLENELGPVLIDAKDRLEATAFAVGTGSTQPKGIVTALQAVTASRVSATTNATFGLIDIYALDAALPARHQGNASWLGHKSILNLARRFGEGVSGNAAHWADGLAPGQPAQLIGHPVYLSSDMTSSLSAATASNDDVVVLGDFRKYAIIDRVGMFLVREALVKGTNRRPTGEAGIYAFWRVGSDVLDANAFRLLRV